MTDFADLAAKGYPVVPCPNDAYRDDLWSKANDGAHRPECTSCRGTNIGLAATADVILAEHAEVERLRG